MLCVHVVINNNNVCLLFISYCCLFFVDTGNRVTILCFTSLEKSAWEKNLWIRMLLVTNPIGRVTT